MSAQEVAGDDRRAGRSARPASSPPCRIGLPRTHGLNNSRWSPCDFLLRVRRHGAGLLREREIGVAGPIGRLHGGVAG